MTDTERRPSEPSRAHVAGDGNTLTTSTAVVVIGSLAIGIPGAYVSHVMSIVIVACGLLALRSPDVTPVVDSVDHDDAPQRSHGQAVD